MAIHDHTLLKSAGSDLPARTEKQISADQRKEDRRRKAAMKQKEKEEQQLQAEVKEKETDNRFTSPEFIGAIVDSFGPIDFDPCWHQASAVAPKAWLDVRQGDNGLRDPWFGTLVFVNPPWSAQDKWVRRAYHQWASGNAHTVLCLVPAKTDTRFFHSTLVKQADLYFIEGRPRFSKEDGTSEVTKVATMLVIFGATDDQKMRMAQHIRGAWWPAHKPSPIRTGAGHVSSAGTINYGGRHTCTLPIVGSGTQLIAFCSPTIG